MDRVELSEGDREIVFGFKDGVVVGVRVGENTWMGDSSGD